VGDSIQHLIILVHGLGGNSNDFKNLMGVFMQGLNLEEYYLYSSRCNEKYFTFAGISECGERLVNEIEELQDEIGLKNGVKISFIGHSLGGLIIRYSIGLMKKRMIFDYFTPHIYMSFATPHIGTRRETSIFNSLIQWYTKSYVDKTGMELLLEDSNIPLLRVLADPQFEYFQALELFKYRVLYSNIRNDVPVPFYTSSITNMDPYPQNILKEEFLDDYPHVIKESKVVQNLNEDYSTYFYDDKKSEDLQFILYNLHSLKWIRYDVLFSHVLAHEMIIYKHKIMDEIDGRDIIYHALNLFSNVEEENMENMI